MSISSSHSQDASSTSCQFHWTLTKWITLFLNLLFSLAKMHIGVSSVVMSSCSCNSDKFITRCCSLSRKCFLSIDTWNTSWISVNISSSSKRYYTTPTLLMILKDPIYLGASFPFFSKCLTPFIMKPSASRSIQPQTQKVFASYLRSSSACFASQGYGLESLLYSLLSLWPSLVLTVNYPLAQPNKLVTYKASHTMPHRIHTNRRVVTIIIHKLYKW